MKNTLLLILMFATFLGLRAQEVERTIIVEHFTNTRCGVCSSRNPGFYNNLNAQEGVLHLAVHPSSPYSNCLFNQANPSENDARTNYYGIYGSTPKLVIQGSNISPGANYGSASIFEPFQNQTTPVSLNILQTKTDGEISVEITITAEADNDLGTAQLFLAVAEKEVMYNAPNGENIHYDVFRRTFTGEPTGITVEVPPTAGVSATVSATVAPNSDWVFDQLFALAILQETDSKAVIQAAASDPSDNGPVGIREVNTLPATIFPNPVQNLLDVQLETTEPATFRLLNVKGQVLQSGSFSGQTRVDMSAFANGIYWLEVQTAAGNAVRKIVK
jgi:hypothetical protein